MGLPQQKFREILLHLLYSYDVAKNEDEDMIDFIMHQFLITKSSVRQALERRGVLLTKSVEIDDWITKTSTSYQFVRIPRIERNILRIGVFELLFDPLIPPKVAIAEAVRLARKFATVEGATFVNAILDGIYQSTKKNEVCVKQEELITSHV